MIVKIININGGSKMNTEQMTNKEFVEAIKCILNHELLLKGKNSTLENLIKSNENPKENPLILVDKETELTRYDVINSYIKELEAEKKYIEDYFKIQIGDYETAYIGDRKLTFKNQSRNTIDTQRLKIEQPEIAKEYTKTNTSRVLKISKRIFDRV